MFINIDPSSGLPIYLHVVQQIKTAVAMGRLQPEGPCPPSGSRRHFPDFPERSLKTKVMKKLSAIALLLALALASTAGCATEDSDTPNAKAALAVGAAAPDFTLPDADGRAHSLASLKGKSGTLILFVATECPYSNAYNERMQKLAEEYKAKGFNVVGINSNVAEPAAEVKSHAAEKGLTFAILKDPNNKIADRFSAQVTPEAYLLDASGKLVYHGRIDNSRNGDSISSNDLRDALEAVLAGKAVEKAEVNAFGCSFKRAS